MKVRKKDFMFKFLPANVDNCGSLFSISAERRIVNTETAFMARKQTRRNSDTTSQDKSKKVTFDEDVTTYMYDEENENKKDKTNKKSKRERVRNINEYHKILGHPSEDTTRLTTKFYNLKLTRDWKICTECALAKRMQRRLSRETEHTAKEPGGRMFLNLASLNFTTMGDNRHIGLLVDEYSRLKFQVKYVKVAPSLRTCFAPTC